MLRDIVDQMGLDGEALKDKKIICKGDLLSVWNSRYFCHVVSANNRLAVQLQSESSLNDRLNHIESVTGLFHFQMAIMNLLFKAHRGEDREFGSLRG